MKLRFRVKGWMSRETYEELTEFSRYLGREGDRALFELDAEKMKASGYTLRDVYLKLSSLEVEEDDLKQIWETYRREHSVELSLEEGTIKVRSRVYLKDFLSSLKGLSYDSPERAYLAPPHMYSDLVRLLSSAGLFVEDRVGLLGARLPREIQFKGELRPYQLEALRAWEKNYYRGVIALPTGAGKTVVAIKATALLSVPTLVIVYTRDHVRQWAEAYAKFTDAAGLVGKYYGDEKTLGPITISTYQSARMMLNKFSSRYSFVIFDEAHHLPAEKFKTLAYYLAAPYRMALSATPEREDGKHAEIFPLVGGVVYHKSPQELSEQGYLAPFVLKRVRVELSRAEMERYEKLRERFHELIGEQSFQQLVEAAKRGDRRAIEALRIHAEMRAIVQYSESKLKAAEEIARRELEKGNKIIIFTQLKEQAEEMARRLNALLLHGDLGAREREEALRLFKSQSSGVLVVTTVGDEGLDIPDARVGILLSGTGSRRQFVQRLGRLLRPQQGKSAILYEIIARGTSEEFQSRRRRESL
ncbi:MAG: DEAD/DEAH box helicase [Acidilobaceae archaeon]|nr:DEAD/DEAH box helicase [Acidilobaceae archaeon]MCX8165457.1 DEAD/DEAH box helicase [Acidilobaceae archaeon]MDW7973884.1 DEAD/DEAH box helicase [Sulfolobales archaeon]